MDDTNQHLHRVVGIDLGTTYSAVAAFDREEGTAHIIPDAEREPAAVTTPSVVGYDPQARQLVVGAAAKAAMSEPGRGQDTIIEIKREMGALFTEETLGRFGAGKTSFKADDPLHVRLRGEWLRPQEISALVLMRMKEIAERGLGGQIHDAVVTVPAYFTERQKKATEEAALLAGLHPRQLIPEPTAAAIAYGLDQADDERRIYLVYDLGGGTFDVSIIQAQENQIDVLATAGDARLGGGDFDAAIAEWLNKRAGRSAPNDDERLQALAAAEKAKRNLSLHTTTTVDLGNGTTPVELSREQFQSLIEPTLARSLRKVDEALELAKDKGVTRDQVDAVLLVGGSTRIRQIAKMLVEHFDRDDDFVRADGDPDALVARGAAIVAHRFEASDSFDLNRRPSAERPADVDDFAITLIAEHTLGVGVEGGKCDPLIPRGTKIPARQQKRYTNQKDSEDIEVPIYQGESKVMFENTRVGSILIDKIEPRPAGYHQLDITFALDVNGLLDVKVHHVNTDREFGLNVNRSTDIGKVDMLGVSRERLRRLSTPAPLEPEEPAEDISRFVLPEPVDAAPDKDLAPDTPIHSDAVPGEFRRMFRKVTAWVTENEPPAELAVALRDFTDAVRDNASADALEPLADRLEDAYDSARR